MSAQLTSLLVAGALDSLTYWSLAFLIASGLTVVFGMLGFLNVAHAAFYMLAAYVTYSIVGATHSFWLALALAPLLTTLVGLALEATIFRRLYRAGHVAQLLLTLGVADVIAEGAKTIWGDGALSVQPPASLGGRIILLGATLPTYHLFIVAVAVVLMAVLGVLLAFTRIGMVVRAAAVYPSMVEALGFRLRSIHIGVFGLGLWLAAVAGVVMAPLAGAYPSMADDALVQAFVVVVAGGLGSLAGACIVAGLLGVLQGFGNIFLSDYAAFFPFVVLAGILLVRPLGLFGEKAAA